MKDGAKKIFSISPLKITVLIIMIALTLLLLDVPFLRFMELKAFDLRILSRGKIPSGGETIIAAIDEKSLSELGRWPWPRTTIAKLVDTLKSHGAKAVGFDIVFSEPDENSSLKTIAGLTKEARSMGITDKKFMELMDEKKAMADTDAILAKSIERAKNITLGYFFHTSKKEIMHLTESDNVSAIEDISGSKYSAIKAAKNSNEAALIKAYAAAPNLKQLSEVAENSGYFNAFPDTDGAIRWSPLVIKFQDGYYASLSLSLLIQYLDWPMAVLNLGELGVEGIRLDSVGIPTDDMGRMLINYLGPTKTFPHYSISDIINGRIAPDKFRGKIVVVGATATGIYDLRLTPFSTVYPGVEIHATVVDNILHQNFLKHSWWTKFLDVIFIIIVGSIMGLLIPRLKSAIQGILISLFFISAFIAVNISLFSRYNIWLNLIYPVLTMIAVYLGITVYRYITEEKEKKKVRNAFQYYLTASVITEMLKDPSKLKLGGDKKLLTVLFSDIRGFTTISEQLAPEELVQLLNEYLTVMTDIVFKYDGLLDKYMGDAIMAVYGAPLDQPDHAIRACKTALEMMQALKKLQDKWTGEGRPALNIGVGINSGDMVVGNMGSRMRFDYTVMGDSVNLGSRLEGINKEYGTNIVISEFTQDIVKYELYCRELDAVRVKGKAHPVKIYELLSEMKDADPYRQFVEIFENGLAKYKQVLWDEAIAAFRKVLEIRPDDPPAKLYLKRCQELKENPPPQPWDGVFTMTKK
ncbi:MAG TPA: adenylate/guanylate cyclase domain-containing protein [Syntrophales bacterium]|nr:adenylate/guanylate cyclase domain-containing protein [Syntrophales bacterium]